LAHDTNAAWACILSDSLFRTIAMPRRATKCGVKHALGQTRGPWCPAAPEHTTSYVVSTTSGLGTRPLSPALLQALLLNPALASSDDS